jgi:hypothetical protein
MHKLLCLKQSCGQKKSKKRSNNGKILALKVGCKFENLKPLSKPNLHINESCVEKTLEYKQPIMTCYGRQTIITLQQKVPKAQVWAFAKNSHIMFEPYGHNLCHELIPWSLGIV